MLRLTFHLVLAAAFAAGPAPKDKPTSPCNNNPDVLYEDGLKDFNQKLLKSAIEKFEEAHRCSKNPLILYNIGLAYLRLYEVEQQKEQIERARAALVDYVKAIEQDPSLGADPEEVRPMLAEIEAELERLKPPEDEPKPEPAPPAEVPKDPGKKQRGIGIGLIAGGSALTAVGIAVGAAFASKGRSLSYELQGPDGEGGLYDEFRAKGCHTDPSMDASGATGCDDLRAQRDEIRAEGFRTNAIAYGMVAVGAVGLGLVIGGAVAYAKGKKTSAAWEAGQQAGVRVMPTFTGFMLQGRF
ncbi:MAG TPA: hypothetical protein VIK91_06670 [Nannocystis sp.]